MAGGISSPSKRNSVVSLAGRSAGLMYAEVELVNFVGPAGSGAFFIGLTKSNPPPLSGGASAQSISWRHFGGVAAVAPVSPTFIAAPVLAIGNVVRMAIDFTTGKVWIGLVGSAWLGGGDPASGALPTFLVTAGRYFVTSMAGGVSVAATWVVRIRTGAAQFTGVVPTGFSPWAVGAAATGPPDDLVFGLHGDGTNGSSVFTDSSAYAHVMTQTGTVTTATDGAAFGSSSILFTGIGSLRTGSNLAELNLPSGTISGFFTFGVGNIAAASKRPLFDFAQGFDHKLLARANHTGNDLTVFTQAAPAVGIVCAVTWVAGQRHHVEVGWNAGNVYVFFDGALVGQQASGPTVTDASVWINEESAGGPAGAAPVTHTVDDFAVWRALRHTASFTPPAATDF